jgi:hypothetical protein
MPCFFYLPLQPPFVVFGGVCLVLEKAVHLQLEAAGTIKIKSQAIFLI